ncbi:PREDICTED: uncharacterized protein LOC109116046 [Tarenaya hassleriana]|uniref:uncharacterized protein LOC109116046 n=1 Tax=Tarenaya hassleriana TaxID=28532 RepID=UPI0008FD839F|nr:PREDICTED: uncharacterized protein LOC109116046 [Tarenaya hassleriana]
MPEIDDMPPPIRKDKRGEPQRLSDLEKLTSDALKAAHVAGDKGDYTVSREALRCVHVLRRINSLPLDHRVISIPDNLRPLQYLAKNRNPKISSEARSVLQHWRNLLSGNQKDPVSGSSSSESTPKKEKKKTSIGRTESRRNDKDSAGGTIKKASPSGNNNQKKTPIGSCSTPEVQTQKKASIPEYQEVYEILKKAHDAVKGRNFLAAEDSRRCVVTLKGLFLVPRRVARDLLLATDAKSRMQSLKTHADTDVGSMAESLFDYWMLLV